MFQLLTRIRRLFTTPVGAATAVQPKQAETSGRYRAEPRGEMWVVADNGRVAFGPWAGPGAKEKAHDYAALLNSNEVIRRRYAAAHV
jgi:hypothetical protein